MVKSTQNVLEKSRETLPLGVELARRRGEHQIRLETIADALQVDLKTLQALEAETITNTTLTQNYANSLDTLIANKKRNPATEVCPIKSINQLGSDGKLTRPHGDESTRGYLKRFLWIALFVMLVVVLVSVSPDWLNNLW